MHLIVFDSEIRNNFTPINLNKPTFELLIGGKTILENLLEIINPDKYSLLIPDYLKNNTENKHKVNINEEINEVDEKEIVFVNSLINLNNIPLEKLKREENFALISDNNLVLAKCKIRKINNLTNNNKELIKIIKNHNIKLESENNVLIKYPWKLLEMNNQLLIRNINKKLLNKKINLRKSSNKFINIIGSEKSILMGKEVRIENVIFDTTNGPIEISDNCKLLGYNRICGPCYIGNDTVIKSCIIGSGTMIGKYAKISGEVENSIISNFSNKSHYGYIGDSYIGEWVNIGAGTTISNLKNTYGKISMVINDELINTDKSKIGSIIGDYVKTSIGTYIYSGKKIGISSHLHGYVTTDIPSFVIYSNINKSICTELYKKSAIKTQKEMMRRRNISYREEEINLLEYLYNLTKDERIKLNYKENKFSIN